MSTRSKGVADQIIDALLEDFPPEASEGSDGEEKVVKPGYYVEKLMNLRKLGADVSITYPNGNGFLTEVDGVFAFSKDVRVAITAEGFEGVGDGTGSVAIILDKEFNAKKLTNAIKGASSDGLKRACLNLGVNLKTYLKNDLDNKDEEEENERPSRRSSRSERPSSRRSQRDDDEQQDDEEEERPSRRSSRSSDRGESRGRSSRGSSNEWDGNKEIPFGSYKGTKYKDIHGGWLSFMSEKDLDPPASDDIAAEIDRRGDDYDPEEKDPNYKPKGRRGGGQTQRSSGRRSGRALNNDYR